MVAKLWEGASNLLTALCLWLPMALSKSQSLTMSCLLASWEVPICPVYSCPRGYAYAVSSVFLLPDPISPCGDPSSSKAQIKHHQNLPNYCVFFAPKHFSPFESILTLSCFLVYCLSSPTKMSTPRGQEPCLSLFIQWPQPTCWDWSLLNPVCVCAHAHACVFFSHLDNRIC